MDVGSGDFDTHISRGTRVQADKKVVTIDMQGHCLKCILAGTLDHFLPYASEVAALTRIKPDCMVGRPEVLT